jgi:hypothetical protein
MRALASLIVVGFLWGAFAEGASGEGYARPRGASPAHFALVPANRECTTPNRTHGAPLSFGSCAPARLSSDWLTAGTPDNNQLPSAMVAYFQASVRPGNPANTTDEADVTLGVFVNDVYNNTRFTKDEFDYAGTLRAAVPLKITDTDNLPGAGTTQPFLFGFQVPCVSNGDPNVGGTCSVMTSVETLVPGAVKEGSRAIWEIGQTRVYDGGDDSDGSTTADNTIFAVQGVFVP